MVDFLQYVATCSAMSDIAELNHDVLYTAFKAQVPPADVVNSMQDTFNACIANIFRV